MPRLFRPTATLTLIFLLAFAAHASALGWKISSMGASLDYEAPIFMVINNRGSAAYVQWVEGQDSRLVFHQNGTLYGIPIPNLDTVSAINDNDCITGTVFSEEGNMHGFLFCDGQLEYFGQEYPFLSVADMNNAGEIIGSYMPSETANDTPFLYSNGRLTPLPTLDGPYAGAVDINDRGEIVGSASTLPDGYDRAVLYQNGTLLNLGTMGGPYSSAWAINENGMLIGIADDEMGMGQAFLCADGRTMVQLAPGSLSSYPNDINDNGMVVGEWALNESKWNGFVYKDGRFIDLPPPRGYTLGMWHVNNRDIALGSMMHDQSGVETVVVFTEELGIVPLKDLIVNGQGWDIITVEGIGDDNSIIGLGEFQGRLHVYLLTAESY